MAKLTCKEKAKWKKISQEPLDYEYIVKNKEFLDLKLVSRYSLITPSIIKQYNLTNYIDWTELVLHQPFVATNPEFIWNNSTKIDWERVSYSPYLTEQMMDDFSSYLNWNTVICRHKFNEEILDRFSKFINWQQACISQKLSEDYLERNYKRLKPYLYEICKYQKLSENYIRNHKDDLDWDIVSEYQNLKENFIEEMKDYVNWVWISEKQKLSKDFISKHKDVLILNRLISRKISLPKEIKSSEYFKIYKIYNNRKRVYG